MTHTDETAAANPAAAAARAAVIGQTFALVSAASLYRDHPLTDAVRELRRQLLADDDNDRAELATAAAILAVQSDRGEIGTPFGMLAVPAGAVAAGMVALEEAGCQNPGPCPGPDGAPLPGTACGRCVALGTLQEATGLTGKDLTGE